MGWMGSIVILARCKFHFIREQENLVYLPISLYLFDFHSFPYI